MLSEKENYLRCLHGEMPEYVPRYTMGMSRAEGEPPSDMLMPPGFMFEGMIKNRVDVWGVKYVESTAIEGSAIPDNSSFILNDIRDWRDIIKAPDTSGFDWEAMVKKDLEDKNVDRRKSAVALDCTIGGLFQMLMAFMGFEEGMIAMFEEPDEVKELFQYLSDFLYHVTTHYIDIMKPDVLALLDDTAAWHNPFISRNMYVEFLLPHYDRLAKLGRDRGLPISMHNCGKCEGILDDLVGIGVTAWDPAQTCNDLKAVKAKYGRKLVIAGGWDPRENLLKPDVTYEEVYDYVKSRMDLLTPGGGYCFTGGFAGAVGDTSKVAKNAMVNKAFNELRYKYY
jgi:uroporphyrinogen-III decarboxylase